MRILAHRGAESVAPENTFAAFDLAIKICPDGIETDVQSTLDGKLVLMHDLTLDRTTNGTGLVKKRTWHYLKKLDAGSKFDSKFASERIPLLEDFLVKYGKLTHVDLEIKQPGIEYKVLEMVEENNCLANITFTSVDYQTLVNIKQKNKKVKVGWLTDNVSDETLQKVLDAHIDQFSPRVDLVTKESINNYHKLKLFVRVWGVKTIEIAKKAVKIGVDGMTFHSPDLLLTELKKI